MPFKVHPHMLRHACGYALANKGTDTRTLQAYLGHRSIQSRCATANWRLGGLRTCGGSPYLNFTTFVSVCSQSGHSKVRRS